MAGQAPKGRWSFRCGKKEGESLGRQIQQNLKIALGVDQTTWDQVCLWVHIYRLISSSRYAGPSRVAEAEASVLWLPDAKSVLIGEDLDGGKD